MRLRSLYFGSSHKAALFQYGLMAFDIITVSFFIVTTFSPNYPWFLPLEIGIGLVLLLDFIARIVIAPRRIGHLLQPATIADIIVIVSLILPAFVDLGFLRVLRSLRLLRSYHLFGMLKRDSHWFRRNEEVVQSLLNLAVFIFVVTAMVYVTQHEHNEGINNYIDSLYFTVATLTTTGFGDITLVGEFGQLLSVLIMIFGISLFLRLIQTIFRPAKVRHTCPDCGLLRHDPDSVHCKHCGHVLNIPNEGE